MADPSLRGPAPEQQVAAQAARMKGGFDAISKVHRGGSSHHATQALCSCLENQSTGHLWGFMVGQQHRLA